MPDFNLAAMSLAELRYLQKSVAKAISTFEARQKAEAREKVEMLAKGLGFTLAELAELEEPKRKRAHSSKIYRHPENPTLTWSGQSPKFGWIAAYEAVEAPVKSPHLAVEALCDAIRCDMSQ